MNRPRQPRAILVGMGETAGYCGQLVAGFRELGVRADHLDLAPDPLSYRTGRGPAHVEVVRWLEQRRRRSTRARPAWTLLHRAAMALLLVHALATYDAFVFRAGDSFLGLRDLPLLRRLGKRVVVVFFGSDSRPSYLNGAEVARGITGSRAAAETAAKRRIIARIEASATAIVCHTMTAHVHRRPVVAFLELGIPRRAPVAPALVERATEDGPLRVLHAPSRTLDKGTDVVRAAVEEARNAGANVELEVVTGRPNRDVLAAIAASDFVIDQVYSDSPLAGFAAEAAALGRPAIVGGYAWDDLRRVTPAEVMPPSHVCRPEDLADAIRRLASDNAYRRELGERSRRYVAERWTPSAVARRFLTLFAGEAPESWWFDPARVEYTHGMGMSERTAADSIRAVVETSGAAGLGVSDKPELERRLVEFAASGTASDMAGA
jgi:glycosyltransferase involved in cell wall biosynthesis